MLQRFKIKLFEEADKEKYPVIVPSHSVLRCVKVLSEDKIGAGVFAIYDCPDIFTTDFVDEFIIVKPGERTPSNVDYIDILDAVFSDTVDGVEIQGVLIVPVYRIRSGAMVGGVQEENRFKLNNTTNTLMTTLAPVKSTRAARGKTLENKEAKTKPKK